MDPPQGFDRIDIEQLPCFLAKYMFNHVIRAQRSRIENEPHVQSMTISEYSSNDQYYFTIDGTVYVKRAHSG